MIFRGANINPRVFDLLVSAAKAKKIPHQVASAARGTAPMPPDAASRGGWPPFCFRPAALHAHA